MAGPLYEVAVSSYMKFARADAVGAPVVFVSDGFCFFLVHGCLQ
jgi:hypothetical protein